MSEALCRSKKSAYFNVVYMGNVTYLQFIYQLEYRKFTVKLYQMIFSLLTAHDLDHCKLSLSLYNGTFMAEKNTSVSYTTNKESLDKPGCLSYHVFAHSVCAFSLWSIFSIGYSYCETWESVLFLCTLFFGDQTQNTSVCISVICQCIIYL